MKGFILALMLLLSFAVSAADNVVVIANHINASQLSRYEIFQIYTLRQLKWDDGSYVIVFLLPDSQEETAYFAEKIAGMSPQRLSRLRELSGTKSVARILTFRDGQDAADRLNDVYGGIAYVSSTTKVGPRTTVISLSK
jgi:hypothetical protein